MPAGSRHDHERAKILFAASVGVALLQTVLGERLAGRYLDDYWVTVGVAWTVALVLAREGHTNTTADGVPERSWSALGGAATLAAIVLLVVVPTYHSFHRLLPLLAGVGMSLVASGPSGIGRHRRELLMLALPAVNPFPEYLRTLLAPTSWMALCASAIGRATGYPMVADGNVIQMPTGTLDVLTDCGGLLAISRLWALVAIVIALFPTSRWQKAALVGSAVLVGFVSNAFRVEMLAVTVAEGNRGRFDYWHQGPGASVFALLSTAAAAPAWWLVLRRSRPASRRRALLSPQTP